MDWIIDKVEQKQKANEQTRKMPREPPPKEMRPSFG
jgi:hypothetical protein